MFYFTQKKYISHKLQGGYCVYPFPLLMLQGDKVWKLLYSTNLANARPNLKNTILWVIMFNVIHYRISFFSRKYLYKLFHSFYSRHKSGVSLCISLNCTTICTMLHLFVVISMIQTEIPNPAFVRMPKRLNVSHI